MSLKKNKTLLYIVVLLVVAVGCGVGYQVFRYQQAEQKKIEEQQAIEKARQEAVKEYEEVLSNFVREVSAEIKAYKTQRTVLKELTRPHNYGTPQLAKQNYEEFKNQILPALRKQAQRVLGVFDLSGARLDQVLETKPEEARLYIRTKWLAMKDVEYRAYKDFFDADDQVLSAYEELLRFYYVKSKSYKVTEDEFVFNNPEDKKAEQDLLKIIKDLQKPDEKNEDVSPEGVKPTPKP